MNNKPPTDFEDLSGDDEAVRPEKIEHQAPTDVTTSQARTNARQAAETARVRGNQGKDRKGVTRNAEHQTVHEAAGDHAIHDENTDREADDIYTTEGENEVHEWRRHSALDAPPARPGYVMRFIRVRLGTTRDTANWIGKQREGWRPVKASSVTGRSLPTTQLEGGAEVIGVEDLILCEMPERVFQQRASFYRNKLDQQNAAIERQLREAVRGGQGFGPIEQARNTSVSVRAPGRSHVGVAADE